VKHVDFIYKVIERSLFIALALAMFLAPVPSRAAPHLTSDDCTTSAGTACPYQPDTVYVQCPAGTGTTYSTTPAIDTNGTCPQGGCVGTSTKGAAYFMVDMALVSGSGPGVTCAAWWSNKVAGASPQASFTSPNALTAPGTVRLVP